jgi:hypothetical protein
LLKCLQESTSDTSTDSIIQQKQLSTQQPTSVAPDEIWETT